MESNTRSSAKTKRRSPMDNAPMEKVMVVLLVTSSSSYEPPSVPEVRSGVEG